MILDRIKAATKQGKRFTSILVSEVDNIIGTRRLLEENDYKTEIVLDTKSNKVEILKVTW